MSMIRHLACAALAAGTLAMPAAAQQGPISIPCAGNISVTPQLIRAQTAPDGSTAWAVQMQNRQNYGIAVVVTATGFSAPLRVPQPERRMIVSGGGTSQLMMIDAASGNAPPAAISFVLDSQGGGGPTIRVSQCSRWPAATGG